jgi:hypothetical protein
MEKDVGIVHGRLVKYVNEMESGSSTAISAQEAFHIQRSRKPKQPPKWPRETTRLVTQRERESRGLPRQVLPSLCPGIE